MSYNLCDLMVVYMVDLMSCLVLHQLNFESMDNYLIYEYIYAS